MRGILQELEKIGVIPVIKIDDAEKAVPLGRALLAGGLSCAEVTFRTATGEEAIRRMAAEVPGLLVGAGTVLSVEQVDRAAAAGARFIVSPGFNPAVVRRCLEKAVLPIPGCSTPSEMEAALALGLDAVKFFPAEEAGGLPYIKAVSAPYPTLKFIPTGGIHPGNLAKYLAFERVAACGGSWMVPPTAINAGDFAGITALAAEAVKIAACRLSSAAPETAPRPLPASGKSVVTFGEIMLRLAPPAYYRFVQAASFDASYGGGEANVAVSLAAFGMDAAFVTRLPAHEIGQGALNKLREAGVDTRWIALGGGRLGIYFLEKGASQRPSKVIYDRAHSAFSEAGERDFDWNAIFDGAAWFHFTGITPALSDNAAALCHQACKTARAKGLTVSCDLNYRKNLWTREKAGDVMAKLMENVDVCIANEEDAADVFGIHAGSSSLLSGKLSRDGYKKVASQLAERFGFKLTAITLRESISASDNNWAALLYDGKDYFFSKKYPIHIVDRIGGGDSFSAGLIYAKLCGYCPQESVEFAAAASCLKHSIEGDFNLVSVDEVKKLAAGDGSGRVQR